MFVKIHFTFFSYKISSGKREETGTTPGIAKIANLLKNGISVVLAAADTYRAGAIEHSQERGEKLGFKVITQKYGADSSAVARDAIEYAAKHAIQVTLRSLLKD